jgi:two-component system nitrate/nitrite response regulator NarL
MSVTTTIAVVDDHPLFREGVVRSLEESGRFEVIAQGRTAEDAVRIVQSSNPDILLLDLSMPGGGQATLTSLAESHPTQKTVVLTVSEADEDVTAALQAGVRGYVLKGIGSQALMEVLSSVADGEQYVSPTLSARLLSKLSRPADSAAEPLATLTVREREVLEEVSTGMSNKQVARRLGLEEKTVKHHMSRVLAKLHVANRTEAALMWARSRSASFQNVHSR